MDVKKVNVLIVEDNATEAVILTKLLKRLKNPSFDFNHVASLGEFDAQISLASPDIILLDLNLPDSMGLDTVKHVQERVPDIPFVVLTGTDDDETAARAIQKGAQDYLIKGSYSIQLLGRIIRYAIERKRAQVALRESEKNYRVLIKNSPDAIFVESMDGIVLDANPAAGRLHGIPYKKLIGKHVKELVPPERRDKVVSDFPRLASGDCLQLESFSYTNSGESIPVEIRASQIEYTGASAVLLHVRDITQRKSAEVDKTRLEKQLQQAQKMEAIGTLAGGIAHDFNNILSAMIGYTEMSLKDTAEETAVYSNLGQVLKAGCRARDLVKQITTFSKTGEQKRLPSRIDLIVREALKLIRASIPATIEIEDNVDPNCLPVMADPSQIHQLIMNLCTNAAQAINQSGGTIRVQLRNKTLIESEVQNLAAGEYLHLTVADDGHGIDPAIIERIFDPFFTTKERDEGTGLGLSVVHGIINTHEGEIIVESTPGNGTCFEIYLPALPINVEEEVSEQPASIGGKERILCIDDEVMLAEMMQQMLEHLGYNVEIRTSSLDAFEKFRADPQAFDMIITDEAMPRMSGTLLASKITGLRPDIPILLCTGFSQELPSDQARKAGILGTIMKPVLMNELGHAVRSALDGAPSLALLS